MLKLKMPNTVFKKKKKKVKMMQLWGMNEDLDAMLFQLICSREKQAVVATSSSEFFVMKDNTT